MNPNVLTQFNSTPQPRQFILLNEQQNEIIVPNGWKRLIDENGLVFYKTPSNIILKSRQEINNYLLSSNTCKCGLECPLDINKIFNFDPKYKSINGESSSNNNNKTCCVHSSPSSAIINNNNKQEIKIKSPNKRKPIPQPLAPSPNPNNHESTQIPKKRVENQNK